MKVSNLSIFFLIFLLGITAISRAEVIFEYENETLMFVNSNKTISLKIFNNGYQSVNETFTCYSQLKFECPSRIVLNPGETKIIKIKIFSESEPGTFDFQFFMNKLIGKIKVNITASDAMNSIIKSYEKKIEKLKANNPNIEELIEAEVELNAAKKLISTGEYQNALDELDIVKKDLDIASKKAMGIPIKNFSSAILVVMVFLVISSSYYLMYKMVKMNPQETERKFIRELMIVKDQVGKVEEKKEPLEVKDLEKMIQKMKNMGEDVTELEVDLKLIKKLKREGKFVLAEKYLNKIRERLEWDMRW